VVANLTPTKIRKLCSLFFLKALQYELILKPYHHPPMFCSEHHVQAVQL